MQGMETFPVLEFSKSWRFFIQFFTMGIFGAPENSSFPGQPSASKCFFLSLPSVSFNYYYFILFYDTRQFCRSYTSNSITKDTQMSGSQGMPTIPQTSPQVRTPPQGNPIGILVVSHSRGGAGGRRHQLCGQFPACECAGSASAEQRQPSHGGSRFEYQQIHALEIYEEISSELRENGPYCFTYEIIWAVLK